jgi:hypothetical protein
MSVYQTDYSSRRAIGLPGQIASEEKCNKISRTVESASGIAFGQPAFQGTGDHGVVAGASQAGSATATAFAGNAANTGTMGAVTVGAGAKEGRYTVTIIEPGTNAGKFSVEDPDGVQIGTGTVAVAFSAGGIGFTIADGATDFSAGEGFNVDVDLSADAPVDFVGLAVLNPAVPANQSNPDAYPQYFTGAFMTMGPMYVVAGDDVAPRQPVYWNPSTKRYTATATQVEIPDAVFETSGGDGDIVEISLNLR